MSIESLKEHLLTRLLVDIDFMTACQMLDERDCAIIRARLPSQAVSSDVPPPTSPLAVKAVPPVPQRPGASSSRAASSAAPRVKAVWDYDGSQTDDLAFRAGDLITVVEETSPDWWRGTCGGRTGLFPSNYVERLPPSPIRQDSQASLSSVASTPVSHQPTYQPSYASQPSAANQAYYGNYSNTSDEKQALVPSPSHADHPAQQNAVVTGTANGPPVPPRKPPKLGKTGQMMANSLASGVGFGAGAAVASEVIHGIF